MSTSENKNEIFPKGEKAPAEYFTGTVWLRLLVPNDPILNCQIANVVFEPGARNNWHTHSGGQMLIVTEGIGYYQEKGKSIQIIRKGDVIKILPDVVQRPLTKEIHIIRKVTSELNKMIELSKTNFGMFANFFQ